MDDTTETINDGGEQEELTVYELAFLLLPKLSEDESVAKVAEIKGLVEKAGGTVLSEGAPKMMELAYTMINKENSKNVKYTDAYFGWIKYENESSHAEELKKSIDALPYMLRFMTIKTIREDVAMQERTSVKPVSYVKPEKPLRAEPTKEEAAKGVSEEEVDKAIEELVTQ